MDAHLSSPTDIVGFRTEAQQLLAHQVPPESVHWHTAVLPANDSGSITQAGHRPHPVPRAAFSIVPASFVRLCEFVVQHRDPDRFALLYRLLWRLVHEPGLRHDHADADMARAQHMAHAVRRDLHKLKINLRFHPVADPAQPGDPLQLAWWEPAHHILDSAVPWIDRRFAAVRWSLLTPERSVYWDREVLHYAGGAQPLAPGAGDEQWLAAWQALFPNRR